MLTGRLREAREKKGLTQRELARLCGLGANQINKYENGAHDLMVETLKNIAMELEVSTDYLLGLANDPHGIATLDDKKPDEREILDAYRRDGWAGVARVGVEKLAEQVP